MVCRGCKAAAAAAAAANVRKADAEFLTTSSLLFVFFLGGGGVKYIYTKYEAHRNKHRGKPAVLRFEVVWCVLSPGLKITELDHFDDLA